MHLTFRAEMRVEADTLHSTDQLSKQNVQPAAVVTLLHHSDALESPGRVLLGRGVDTVEENL